MQFAILPLLVVATQAAFHAAVNNDKSQHLRVSPDVDKSDKKFFGKDYPWDKRPVADKYYVFDHPYPAVQDSNDFDADFVKDENSDGGKWKAQMDYDTLRSNIRKSKDKLRILKENMEKQYEEWMAAKEKAAKGNDAVTEATGEVGTARKAADAAAKRVNDLEGHSQQDGTKVGGAIGDAVKKVQDEMSDLEKCKKALAEAKKRLKQLLKDKEEFEKKKEAAKKSKEAAEAKGVEDAKQKKEAEHKKVKEAKEKAAKESSEDEKEAAAAEKKQKEEEEEAKFDEAAWKRKLVQEKSDHAEALAKYDKQIRDVKLTEDQLARAADNLRKFRRPPYVDGNGGVYNVPESHAFSAGASAAVMLAVLVACFTA